MSRLVRHYARLGLTPGAATHADVAAAYRALALRDHPDVGGSAAAFAELQAARDALLAAPEGAGGALGSLRMYRYRGSQDRPGDKWALLGAVVLPTALGMVVGLRLLYVDTGNVTEGRGVRAGGNSRVRLSDLRRMGAPERAGGRGEGLRGNEGEAAVEVGLPTVLPSNSPGAMRDGTGANGVVLGDRAAAG